MAHFKEEIKAASRKAAAMLSKTPVAVAARYDKRKDRLMVELSSGVSIAFKPRKAQGLERAKPRQLAEIDISPSGLGLYFPSLDADIYLPGLLEGFLGSRRWMAAQLGKKGGSVRSAAKSSAARANGKLGGRPKNTRAKNTGEVVAEV